MILVICPNPAIDTYWHLDAIKSGQSNRIEKEEKYAGGKGVHVALALAELEYKSTLCGIWGGNNGKWIKDQCRSLGIDTSGIDVEKENRTCITLKNNTDWKDTEFLGTGPMITESDYEQFFESYLQLLPSHDVIVLSGSWPPCPINDPYGPFIDAARTQGKMLWLDCSGKVMAESLSHRPWGIHINHKEMQELCQLNNCTAKEIFSQCNWTALTKGKDGLELYDSSGNVIRGHCYLEQVISTIGSGDCLTAGLAAASYSGVEKEEMVRWAVACGAANCLRPELGMLFKSDVDLLKNLVTIQ